MSHFTIMIIGAEPEKQLEPFNENLEVPRFALLKDGKWYERGKMGWWAFISNEKPDETWDKEFKELINGVETDTMLGGFYSYIDKEKSPDMFKKLTKEWDAEDMDGCYALVTFFEESVMPLYEGSNYYVMTDTGGTVANRTKK